MKLRVSAVLFDLDGTLVDSAPDLAGAANEMRQARGLPPLPSVGIAVKLDSDQPAALVTAFADHVRLVLPTI